MEMKPIHLSGANCYLFRADGQFVLVDSGFRNKRDQLVKALEAAGVRPGKLKLIILTHGDVDHVANAAFLRETYGTPIAIHREDAAIVEQANMGAGRKTRPDRISAMGAFVILLGSLTTLFSRTPFERFKPDLFLEDGQSLMPYGLDATIVHLPGHSRGSTGILTSAGNLFCGDLLWNMRKPGPHFLIDDLSAFTASIEKLKSLKIEMVYPGHGDPFKWSDYMSA